MAAYGNGCRLEAGAPGNDKDMGRLVACPTERLA